MIKQSERTSEERADVIGSKGKAPKTNSRAKPLKTGGDLLKRLIRYLEGGTALTEWARQSLDEDRLC